jgi:hypothetical protein
MYRLLKLGIEMVAALVEVGADMAWLVESGWDE